MADYKSYLLTARKLYKSGDNEEAAHHYYMAADTIFREQSLPEHFEVLLTIADELRNCEDYVSATDVLRDLLPELTQWEESEKSKPLLIDAYTQLLLHGIEMDDTSNLLFTLVPFLETLHKVLPEELVNEGLVVDTLRLALRTIRQSAISLVPKDVSSEKLKEIKGLISRSWIDERHPDILRENFIGGSNELKEVGELEKDKFSSISDQEGSSKTEKSGKETTPENANSIADHERNNGEKPEPRERVDPAKGDGTKPPGSKGSMRHRKQPPNRSSSEDAMKSKATGSHSDYMTSPYDERKTSEKSTLATAPHPGDNSARRSTTHTSSGDWFPINIPDSMLRFLGKSGSSKSSNKTDYSTTQPQYNDPHDYLHIIDSSALPTRPKSSSSQTRHNAPIVGADPNRASREQGRRQIVRANSDEAIDLQARRENRPSPKPKTSSQSMPVTNNFETFGTHEGPKDQAGRQADRWFTQLQERCHPIIRDPTYAITDASPQSRIKVAVLDTGLAKSKAAGRPDLVVEYQDRIKACVTFEGAKNGDEDFTDTDGHGTHVAMLVLKTFPNADLYVAKVAYDGAKIKKDDVVKALKWAINTWKVDIINMSFGWMDTDVGDLADLLSKAERKRVLLFAATSNYGLRDPVGMAYPARSDHVVGIDCANGVGESTKSFNPPSNSRNNANWWRFTAPGERVESGYPTNKKEGVDGLVRLSGTSFASPIAAGVAAMVLEFARQPPLSFEPGIFDILKSRFAMRWVLHDLLSDQIDFLGPFRFILPWELFDAKKREDGTYIVGGALESGAPRRYAAEKIVECLRTWKVKDVGDEFYKRLNQRD